jgi:hypothetical protein
VQRIKDEGRKKKEERKKVERRTMKEEDERRTTKQVTKGIGTILPGKSGFPRRVAILPRRRFRMKSEQKVIAEKPQPDTGHQARRPDRHSDVARVPGRRKAARAHTNNGSHAEKYEPEHGRTKRHDGSTIRFPRGENTPVVAGRSASSHTVRYHGPELWLKANGKSDSNGLDESQTAAGRAPAPIVRYF